LIDDLKRIKMSKKKIKKLFLRNKQIIVVTAAALMIVLTSGFVYAYQTQNHSVNNTDGKSDVHDKNKDAVKPSASVAPAESPSTGTPSPSPSASVTPKKSTPTQPSYSPPPSYPTNDVWRITGISLDQASWYCGYGGHGITLSGGAMIYASNNNGGTFSWVVDVTGSNSYPPSSTPIPISFPSGKSWMQTDYVGYNTPRFLDSNAKPGESFRFRVISPNSVSSPWYTVPASASC
jgi:hypothetical protein